ncbi:MAG: hybrid sensor histidine kinase/response regulator [Nevskia sp.]|nr:hybrid sensor histidine kinase/response regulator [Nevskia sp.]
MVMHTDITDPVAAERTARDDEARTASEARCRELSPSIGRQPDQARLRLLETAIDRLSDIVLITEAEPIEEPGPRIVFVNDAFERRTGYRREDVIGKSPRLLQGPATQRDELDRVGAALKRRQPVRAELINYTRSGEPFWLEMDIVPITDDSGGCTHWVAVERDITERKRTEENRRQSQQLEALGQLTGGVAHDFNNLLTVIQGNAELLSEQLRSQPPQRKLAEQIGQAAQRSADLTRRLLAFARKQLLAPRAVNLNHLLTEMEPLLRRTLGGHIEIELVCGDGLWTTLVDPGQLESAVLNLCINARDAMPAGGRLVIETRNLQIDAAHAARYGELGVGAFVSLVVSDQGSGISVAHLPHVFEPFFTTKEQGKGTGLGLAMAYGFVKQSHGHIAIESESGKGTRVSIYLPQVADVEPQQTPVQEPAIGRGQLVLLVEDDNMVRAYARGQLLTLGYRVVEAACGADALALLQQDSSIDLLFTDLAMPGGMSGVALAAAARCLRPALPVLYTSGFAADTVADAGRPDPDMLLLPKPYRRGELAHKLSQALQD